MRKIMLCNNIPYTWYFYELLDVKRAIFGKITQERAATTAASGRLAGDVMMMGLVVLAGGSLV